MFTPPFRVGKKQKRAVLDSLGNEVVIFNVGLEDMAELYCDMLNETNYANIEHKLRELHKRTNNKFSKNESI